VDRSPSTHIEERGLNAYLDKGAVWHGVVATEADLAVSRLVTPSVHADYMRLMARTAEAEEVTAAIRRGVERADQNVKKAARAIEDCLRATPNARLPLIDSVARVCAVVDGLCTALDNLGAEPPPGSDALERVLSRASARKGEWASRERALIEQGTRLPSVGAIRIEAGLALAAGLSVFVPLLLFAPLLLGLPASLRSLLGVGVAVAASYLLYRFRSAAVLTHLDEWRKLAVDACTAAEADLNELRSVLNRRIRYVKLQAVRDLRRAVKAAGARFELESGGMARLVTEQFSLADQPEPAASRDDIWCRLSATPAMNDARFDEAFRRDMLSAFSSTLKVAEPPTPLTVLDHEWIIENHVRRFLPEGHGTALTEELLEEAARPFIERLDEQLYWPAEGRVPGGGLNRYAVAGKGFAERSQAPLGLSWSEEMGIALPSGIAVLFGIGTVGHDDE